MATDPGEWDLGFREALQKRREWQGQRQESNTEAPDRGDAMEVFRKVSRNITVAPERSEDTKVFFFWGGGIVCDEWLPPPQGLVCSKCSGGK